MALDQYSPCPCGSGKKFKWCCEPLYDFIGRAHEQDANNQHAAALRIMDEMTAAHGGNPEAWGRKAEMLYTHGRHEEAENALQKAFDLNPNYPFGLYLRAAVRFQEGETVGALLLARKAADAYDPQAAEMLFQVYSLIAEAEMMRNCPLAVRAAMQVMLRLQPASDELRQRFEAVFGSEADLPACARREYTLQSLPAGVDPARAARWKQAAAAYATPRLSDLARVYDAVTTEDPGDAPAWFNLGLARAWVGDNAAAVAALEKYLELENDEEKATTAALVCEVLRCGRGMEEQSDYKTFAFQTQIRNVEAANALFQEWLQTRRLLPLQTQQQQGMMLGMLLEYGKTGLLTAGTPAAEMGRLAGYLTLAGDFMQVSSPLQEPLERLRDEVRTKLALGLNDLPVGKGPAQFHNVVADALVFPLKQATEEAGKELVVNHLRKFYEDGWIHRPRVSLAGATPVDAAAHPRLRRTLRGVVQFLEDCSKGGVVGEYDFGRLRRKLGLDAAAAPGERRGVSPPVAASAAARKLDIPAMGAAELAALAKEELTDEQLGQAYQAAHKLDAGDLAAHFARQLVGRPAAEGGDDRYPWYTFLVTHALKEGDAALALRTLDEARQSDAAHNEGKRFADYEMRRGQILLKGGDVDGAEAAFGAVIGRAPTVAKYRGQAAEAMLSAKQPARALKFAEEGLTAARARNDRDGENYLREMHEAAKRQLK